MKMRLTLLLLTSWMIVLNSCSSDDPAPKSSEAKIASFKFSSFNPEVVGTIDEANGKIAVTVPSGTSVTSLAPVIVVSAKATVNPASGVAKDFTNPVTYTVTAENGRKKSYVVTVQVQKKSDKDLVSFAFNELNPAAPGVIDAVNKKVAVMVPHGTVVTALKPLITVSSGATVNPASGVAKDFTNPVTYTVTAEDGSTRQYVVTVTIQKSSLKKILSFALSEPAVTGTINESAATVGLTVPYGTAVSSLTPTIEVSPGASVSPASGVAKDFTNPVTYTVTAEDGSVSSYVVTVTVESAPSTVPVITSIDKTTYVRGETIVITGKNLKKTGAVSNINFVPFNGSGVTLVRSGTPSSDGTTLSFTIPMDFPVGAYAILVEVGWEYSKEYADAIRINP
jgi:PBP1b-binding outer membrane lipoprotein LpoB